MYQRLSNHIPSWTLSLFALCALGADSAADVLTVGPAKDNTIYADMAGTNSNGAGIYLFSGTQSSSGWPRRALMQFDVSSIPPGSTINSASLTLRVSMTISGGQNMGAHRMTSDWGEGTSDAPGQEGGGTAATDGDATWHSAFHPSTAWVTSGGDFDAVASASTSVGGSGSTPTWSSFGMAADVQAWVDGVSPNYGWTIKHQNEVAFGTAKRFGSRENGSSSSRPVLTIDYTPGPSGPGAGYCYGDGTSTACPCGNTGSAGQGCANTSGSGAILEASGSASISADDLILDCVQLIPSQPGLYFQGNNAVNSGNGSSFGDGLRCAGGAVIRLQVRFADASGGSATNISVATKGGCSAGDVKRYQVWYRDPGNSPCTTQFNLSNGYEITWSA